MLDRWSLGHRAWRKWLYALLAERNTLRRAAALRFTSETEREQSKTLGSSAPHCVVPLGLPPEAWDDLPPFGAFRRAANLDGQPIVLFLGRLDSKKRPDVLLRAFAKVARDFPDAHLVLAGPGAAGYVARLRGEAWELGLGGRVAFPGLLTGRRVQEAFVDADVFVLPSLQENFALAVAEAMAAGCPVIVSRHVALAQEVERHGAGLVVDVEEEPLAKALRALLCDMDHRRSLGCNGRRLILERFTWDRVVGQIIEVYKDVLQGARTSRAWR
jgi:glycosyltransferase involved in cell wall biosynthesis